MSGLPRTVVKWLQGLDLTYPINNPKWDMSNGFLVAEIFSWYYPDAIKMSSFNNGQSLESKMSNWALLKQFIIKNNLEISIELTDATMHCKEGAAILLIENMFQFLTNRPLQKAQAENDIDLTDWAYQQKLAYHARSTATKSIKNNLHATELKTDPNLKLAAHKVEAIISAHVEHRKSERLSHPSRFDIKKSIAERCVQRPVPEIPKGSVESGYDFYNQNNSDVAEKQTKSSIVGTNSATLIDNDSSADKNLKEIKVRQEVYNLNVIN